MRPIASSFARPWGEACGRTGWRVHAWVLLSNHYHLVVETPEANRPVRVQGAGARYHVMSRGDRREASG
jgi:REP element-mobilizing transposase RayT